jgi:hypothetical protein
MKKLIISESERNSILAQHSKHGYNISEQAADMNRKKAIQCFLAKKNLYKGEIDGLIGDKTKTATEQYQTNAGVYPADGVWGPETESKMNPQDKKIFKECQDKHGDLMDKIVGGVSKFLGLDK